MEKENKNILFRKKFLGLLNTEEEKKFEQLCTNNADFRHEYIEYKNISEVVITAENEDLKQLLHRLERKNLTRLWLPIAASIMLLIGISSIFYFNSANDLYMDYFDAYPNVMLNITRGNQHFENELELAFLYYDNGQFSRADEHFERYLKAHNNPNISFYHAMTFMQLNRLEEAKQILLTLLDTRKDFEFIGETRWYLALIHIKESNEQAAIALLRTNKAENNLFKVNETSKLLASLKATDSSK